MAKWLLRQILLSQVLSGTSITSPSLSQRSGKFFGLLQSTTQTSGFLVFGLMRFTFKCARSEEASRSLESDSTCQIIKLAFIVARLGLPDSTAISGAKVIFLDWPLTMTS